MSDLNVSILQQAVENFNNQYQKNAACTENDQVSLQRASALLDGLKGMFSLDDFNVKISGNMFCVATSFDGYVLELSLDPNFDLKLRNVKVTLHFHIQQLEINSFKFVFGFL